MKHFFTILFLLSCLFVSSQNAFQVTINDTSSQNTMGVVATYDGGYALGGYNNVFGAVDVHLSKLNSAGGLLWSWSYGTPQLEQCYAMEQTADSGFIMTGLIHPGVGYRVLSERTDKNGNLLWSKTYGNSGAVHDSYANDVAATSDGGFIFCGLLNNDSTASYDVYLVKTDGNGNKVWSFVYGSAEFEGGLDVIQTSDGGYLVNANAYNPSTLETEMLVLKVNSAGNITTSPIRYLNLGGSYTSGANMIELPGGDFIFCASTTNNATSTYQTLLFRANSTGTSVVWDKEYAPLSGMMHANDIRRTSDGGYLICGTDTAASWIMKTDSLGNLIWSKAFQDGSRTSSLISMDMAANGFSVFAGESDTVDSYSTYALTMDVNGSSCNEIPFTVNVSEASVLHIPAAVTYLQYGINDSTTDHIMNAIATGEVADVLCSEVGIESIPSGNSLLLYPNPANSSVGVTLLSGDAIVEVINALGQIILSMKANAPMLTLDVSDLAPGMYQLVVLNNSQKFVAKFLKQ